MPRASSPCARLLALATWLILFATACGAAEPTSLEHESEPVGVVAEALSTFDCATYEATGYDDGQPFPIQVVTVDGKPVEVATANAYYVMAVAAEADGVELHVVSGFRTMAEQEYLYGCYINCNCNNCNLAAPPGYSNHQSGHALDLGWSGGGYGWLEANAGAFGFQRTVPSENWHWEWWGGGPGGGICAGCSQQQVDACGQFGCNCVAGECAGGFCPGSGCSEQETNDCGAFGCGCVDHQCSGGFCPSNGCTAKEITDCGGYGCNCVDHQCSGGFCPGNGCTAKEITDCGGYGCNCVDHQCSGGFCPGNGCTAKEETDCSGAGCGCVDHACAGAFCEGTGCTAKEELDCDADGCGCSVHECSGGACGEPSETGAGGGPGSVDAAVSGAGGAGSGAAAGGGDDVDPEHDAKGDPGSPGGCGIAAGATPTSSSFGLAAFAALAVIVACGRRRRAP